MAFLKNPRAFAGGNETLLGCCCFERRTGNVIGLGKFGIGFGIGSGRGLEHTRGSCKIVRIELGVLSECLSVSPKGP